MKLLRLVLALLFTGICIPGIGQVSHTISKPYLEFNGSSIIISYDILQCRKKDKFHVRFEVTNSKGNRIIPKNFTGDVGFDIKGGSHKSIKWDIISDSIKVEEGVFIQIHAEFLLPTLGELKVIEARKKRNNAFLQSAILPGWGLSEYTGKKAHLIKGISSYSLIAGSIIYNRKANISYDNYLEEIESPEIDDYFDASVKQDKISEIFAYSAIGIWVIDMVWTMVETFDRQTDIFSVQNRNISVYPSYDPILNSSLLTFKLYF